jgi:hypothetical protein
VTHLTDRDRAYAILGFSIGIAPQEARTRYRELARRFHPDQWVDNHANEGQAARRMRDINWAWLTIQSDFEVPASSPDHQLLAAGANRPEAAWGQRLTEHEKTKIIRAIGAHNPVKMAVGFLLWVTPLGAAWVLVSGHGHPLSQYRVPPTMGELIAAGCLAAFAVGVLVYRSLRNRN